MKFSSTIEIDGRLIGDGQPAYVIAEAGVAHFGSEEKALQLVDLAVEGCADAVKFQIFDASVLISKASPEWQSRLSDRQLEYAAFERIQEYCRSKSITFLATAHDEPSLDFLVSLDVPAYKIGSGEVGNWSFISRTAKFGKPVILSTGMYTLEKVAEAVNLFRQADNPGLVVLHCSTRYPTPPAEVNLNAMRALSQEFGVLSGYSDHTAGYHIPLAAAALGASVIEKHITLDFDVPNAQDWKVSCGPDDLGEFIGRLRDIEAALGSMEKKPTEYEGQQVWARKSLVITKDIDAGTVLDHTHLISKRPGTGIPPDQIGQVIGKTTRRRLEQDCLLNREDIQ